MKMLLRLKHWQVFLIIFLPYLFHTGTTIGRILYMVWFATYFGWMYSIGIIAWDKLPNGHGIKKTYFNISILVMLAFFIFSTFTLKDPYRTEDDSALDFGNSLWVILPIVLYAMGSLLYALHFASKILMSAIEGKVVDFDKSFGYFFAFLFFPIGIWFIQPKAQKLVS